MILTGYQERMVLLIFMAVLISNGITVTAFAGTETLITTNASTSNQRFPAISGDWIVWVDNRNDNLEVNYYTDIFAYNVVTGEEKQITPPASFADHPSISGTKIVYEDWRDDDPDTDIYLYDLDNDTETRITDYPDYQQFPSISGNSIVWQNNLDYGDSTTVPDVFLREIGTITDSLLTPDTATSSQAYPAISGTRVIWEDLDDGNVYMNDISTGITYLLSPDGATFDNPDLSSIAIDNGLVVWQDTNSKKIFLNDTSTWDQKVVNRSGGAGSKTYPSISGNNVTWVENRLGSTDIYLNDLMTEADDVRITSNDAFVYLKDGSPKISGQRIVWVDRRKGDSDIYLYTLDHDETCPVADFTMSSQSGAIPHTIQFNDASTGAVTHWKYEFGDGNVSSDTTASDQNWEYTVPGTYDVRLTVNNPYCRNETPVKNKYKVSVGSSPVAAFTTNVSDGFVELPVQFTDTSIGAETWNWSFGDGTWDNTTQNPKKTYKVAGTYTPYLYINNTWGTASASKTIKVLTGANVIANTSVSGLAFTEPFGSQFVTYTKAGNTLDCTISGTSLICQGAGLADDGWSNITISSNDGIGFVDHGATISGNLSSVSLQIRDIHPAGFSPSIGTASSVNHTLTLDTYPEDAKVQSLLWEGNAGDDLSQFSKIAKNSGFSYFLDLSYTLKIVKTGIPAGGTAKIRMSVNATWVSDNKGRSHTYIERISDDRSTGEVLRTVFLYHDPATNLDYFEAESIHGASTFGLVQLDGTGNAFQLITLTIAGQANPPASSGGSDSSDTYGAPSGSSKGLSAQAPQPVPEQKAPIVFIDPGKTAPLYANSVGVITQETTLTSTDTLASVVLGEGTIAKNSAGNPLSSISIASLVPDAIPATPPSGQAVMIDGRAYELGPDGATFSPGITVTFTIPQAQWGKEYSLMMYDKATGMWAEVPGSFNAKDGTFTAVLSHFCCVALFEKGIGQPAVYQTRTTPQPEPVRLAPVETPAPQPPQNALSIVFSMAEWISGEAVNRSSYITALGIISIIVLTIMLLHRRRNNP